MSIIWTRKANGKQTYHKNLGPIRRMATGSKIKFICILSTQNGGGFLFVDYEDGGAAMAGFEDRKVLGQWVARWRNAHGVEFTIDHRQTGRVSPTHGLLTR